MLRVFAAFLLLMQGVCAVARGGVICLGGGDPDCGMRESETSPTNPDGDCCRSACHADAADGAPLLPAIHPDSPDEECDCHIHLPVPEPQTAAPTKADRTGTDSQCVAAPALSQIMAPIDAKPMA